MTSTTDRPSILFILGDDWGWGDLGCFGHPRVRTPHLDRLADQGCRYTQFYVAAPVCSPSRASFMSGRFPGRLAFHECCQGSREGNDLRGIAYHLPIDAPSVPRELKEAGYRTAHLGKWHMGHDCDSPDPGACGFDHHRSVMANGTDLRDWFVSPDREPGHHPAPAFHDIPFRQVSSQIMVDQAIEWIRDCGDEPFYLQLALLDPHATLMPTPEQMAPYRHLSPGYLDHPGAMTIYYAALSEADRQLGRLFAALDGLGRSDNTLVMFTGDNGPEDIHIRNASHSAAGSSGPFRGRKRSLYEGGVRMPLIMRWPGRIEPGTVDDDAVLSSVDLLPTACALAGINAPDGDGVDFSPAFSDRRWSRSRPLFWEYRFANHSSTIHCSPALAVRDGRWKLLLNPDRSRVELYDIPADPMELTNCTNQHPNEVERLAAAALAFADQLPPGPRDPTAGSNRYPWPA